MQDKLVADLIAAEEQRQREGVELIPSENYVSRDVRTANASVFTNKYSEGTPGRRYYGGQEFTDQLEQLAIDRAKTLFLADHANVQAHSGAQANEAVYYAWCEPGDTILAMDLSHGGHLTHGAPVTRSAREYNFVRYGVKDITTGEIDYDEIERLALEHKPTLIMAGFSAYSRNLDYDRFVQIGAKVGALMVADMSHIAGLIAGGVLENPLDHGFHVMTTTTHKTLRGPRSGLILSRGTPGNPLKKPEKTLDNIPTLIDRAVFPGTQGGPHMHTIAAKAVAFYEAMQPEFAEYAAQIVANAKRLATELESRGFVLVNGGTDNHLILTDIYRSFGIDGKELEKRLDRCGLTLNANAVPDDPLPPFRPSGVRLGTPAVTTRGAGPDDMVRIAEWMLRAVERPNELSAIEREVREWVKTLRDPTTL